MDFAVDLERFAGIFEIDLESDLYLVLESTIDGRGIDEISRDHGLSKRSVHKHLSTLRYRMGVKDKRKIQEKFNKYSMNQRA